jgi:hypothetical protein
VRSELSGKRSEQPEKRSEQSQKRSAEMIERRTRFDTQVIVAWYLGARELDFANDVVGAVAGVVQLCPWKGSEQSDER